MCIIIDNDVAARVLIQDDPEFEPIRKRLEKSRIRIAYGGKLRDELYGNLGVRRELSRLDSAGRARLVPDQSIEEQYALLDLTLCKSNDAHIIALARAAKARVLVSNDKNLWADFKNHRLVSNPPGKVYVYKNRRAAERLLNTPCNMPKF